MQFKKQNTKLILIYSNILLEENFSQWTMKEPMNSHRHLPGVGAHDGHIYVIGGTNESWEAQSLVESYNPSTNRQDNMIFLRRRVRVDYCIVLPTHVLYNYL